MKWWWESFWSAYLWAYEISCPSCTTFGQTRFPALVLDTAMKNTLQINQHASIKHSQKEVKQKRFNISARFNWSYFVNYTVRHKFDKSAIQHIFVLHTVKEITTIIINTFLTYNRCVRNTWCEDVPLVEFMYLVFICMPSESCCR